MQKLLIQVGSVTYAMKAKSVLQRHGLHASVIKTANPKKNEGCGYSVSVENPQVNVAVLLQRENIDILGTKWAT